jgi:predicted GNAT family acetyltransferase
MTRASRNRGKEYEMDWKLEKERSYSEDREGRLLAEATFPCKENGDFDIDRTFVDPNLRGQGIAGEMMEAVAAYLRKNHAKTVATCPYARDWLEKHREAYADIISEHLDDAPPACRIDARH